MKGNYFYYGLITIFFCNAALASEPQPEKKPGYWQRTVETAQSAGQAIKGAGVTGVIAAASAYAGTRLSGTTLHELGHAIVGGLTGLKPTGIEITRLGEGKATFANLPVGTPMTQISNRMLRRQILPMVVAGPSTGAYFNYFMLKKLANDEINRKESLKEQFTKHPAIVGATTAASLGLLQNMANTTMLFPDGKNILGSIAIPLYKNNYLISFRVAAGSYITTSLLATIGTAWWIRNHLYKQWGFEKNPVAQQHLEIQPITSEKSE